jgi:hypothetical protein
MNEAQLTELLERAGEQTAVSPPPIDAMRAGATRRRRRRTAVFSAAGTALAVAGVIGGTTALTTGPPAPVASTTPSTKPVATRTVAIGAVTVTVPADWGTNEIKCGMTPERDTVIIDPSRVVLYCLAPRPDNVESVWLARKPAVDFHADSAVTVGGLPAQRQTTRCKVADEPFFNSECTGAVWIPTAEVWVQAESSGDAAEVDRLLKQIHLAIDSLGVPGFRSAEIDGSATKYTAELKRAGFKWRIATKQDTGVRKGSVIAVSPAVGTLLDQGATVTVTVAG